MAKVWPDKITEIDLLQIDVEQNAYWLDPIVRYSHLLDDEREAARQRWLDKLAAQKPKRERKEVKTGADIIRSQRWELAQARAMHVLQRAAHWKEQERVPAGVPEGGQFGEGGAGPSSSPEAASKRPTIGESQGSAEAKAKVNAVIAAIPAAHAEAIKDAPVLVLKSSKSFAEIEGQSYTTHGLMSADPETGKITGIFVAETAPFFDRSGKEVKIHDVTISNLEKNAAHELGHAYAFAKDLNPRQFTKDLLTGLKRMNKRQKMNALYFMEPKEFFAETYALAYNPSKSKDERYFGGLKRKDAEKIFAEALIKVKAL